MTVALTIAWGSFAEVFAVSVGVVLVAVAIFSIGVVALAKARPELDARAGSDGRATAATNPGAMLAAGFCFLVVAAMVVYGLYLVVHK
jgi:cytochrome bd-type quinol oxidase subunit 2